MIGDIMKKAYLLGYIAMCMAFTPVYAATSLEQIQTYLNGFKTLKGDFEQQSPNGSIVKGHFAIQKPGRMRLDYFNSPQTIFSHDGILYIYDKSSQDVSQMELNQSLAEFLLRSDIDFDSEGIKIKRFEEDDKSVELSLQRVGSEDIGEITLFFQRKPLQLIGWSIVDAQNQRTVVDVDNLKRNQSFTMITDPSQIIGG